MKKLLICGMAMALSVGILSGCSESKTENSGNVTQSSKSVVQSTEVAKNTEVVQKEIEKISFSEVEAYFAEIGDLMNIEAPAFSGWTEKITYSDIENTYSDEVSDCYMQEVQLQYYLFTQIIQLNVKYTLKEDVWEPSVSIDDECVLNDTINGTWGKTVPAGHPMHIDSTMVCNIGKTSDTSCSYDFFWTSRITGGYDDAFSDSDTISAHYDENGKLYEVELAYDEVNGSITIKPEGLVYEPAMSANSQYLLTKE